MYRYADMHIRLSWNISCEKVCKNIVCLSGKFSVCIASYSCTLHYTTHFLLCSLPLFGSVSCQRRHIRHASTRDWIFNSEMLVVIVVVPPDQYHSLYALHSASPEFGPKSFDDIQESEREERAKRGIIG